MKYNYLSKELAKELKEKIREARKEGAYRITAFSCLYKRYIADTPCQASTFLSWLDCPRSRGKVIIRIYYSESVYEEFRVDIWAKLPNDDECDDF